MPRPRAVAAAVLSTAALLLVPARASAAPALGPATRDYHQTHLIVRVVPHVAEGVVDGRTTVRFAPLADGFATLRLHCEETAVLSCKDGADAPLEWKLDGGVLTVSLAKPLAKGAEGEVTVAYRSRPTRGLYFHAPTKESPDTPLEMYSQGEGTDNRRWFPCYDEPDDRCTCEVFATVDADLKTISNGVLVDSKPAEEGRRTDHWKLERRIPTYLVSLIVGRYETVEAKCGDTPLEYNGPVGRAAEVRQGCGFTPDMMAFFETYTERKFPWPRYAQTTVWDFVYGGMENAGATTMNMRLLHTPDVRPTYSSDGLVAHELAHQWFGDLMTCRTWDHIWLNEGFATYFTDLYFEHRDGPDEFALERRRQNRSYMEGTPHPETLGLTPSPRGDVPLELFGGKQYSRGAAILHQLRLELGDEVFRKGIARYVRENDDRAVVSEDFRRSMEAEAGRSLKWFFDQWVYGAGYPVIEASWEVEKSGRVHVVVEQAQPAGSGQTEAFRITLPYRIGGDAETRVASSDGAGAPRAGRFDVRRRRQEFDVEAAGPAPAYLRLGDAGTFARTHVKQSREAWEAMLASDSDPSGRMDAAEALAQWPLEARGALAKGLAKDKVYAVRAACVKSLGVSGAAPVAAIVPALEDTDPRVREAGVDALAERTREEAGTTLLKVARADASPYVRAAAARAIGKVHADGAFEALSALLDVDSHRETVRLAALDGLAALGDRRAIPLAQRFLPYNWKRGDHHGMRQAALNLLTALAPDEPETHATIVRLLSDPYFRMRSWAAEAAGTFGVRSAEARLKAMAEQDTDGGAKAAAKAALDRLAKDAKDAK